MRDVAKQITMIGLLIAAVVESSALVAQEPLYRFEVASIKPSGPKSIRGTDGGPGTRDPEHYSFGSATLRDLIAAAYGVQFEQISSKSALDKQAFDIAAKLPPRTTREQFRLMLRTMLTERFDLKVRLSTKDFSAYVMTVAKGGLKLKEVTQESELVTDKDTQPAASAPKPPSVSAKNTLVGPYDVIHVEGHKEPLSVLIRILRTPDSLPIVDRTNVTGQYDFDFAYNNSLPVANAESDAPPDLVMALRQLGLQLSQQKVPFDLVIVDSVSQQPSEN